jgi:hypothetical protein
MKYKELKSQFVITRNSIDVSSRFASKWHLSLHDLQELARMIKSIEKGEPATTINSKVADVLQKYEVNLIPDGIGWSL